MRSRFFIGLPWGVTNLESGDDVDRIVAAWRRERPDLDVSPLEVLSRVSRLGRHLDLARRSAFQIAGLETWEFDVLSALRRSGRPYQMTPGQLLRQTMVTSGTMTNRVDRLMARGMVDRAVSDADRRAVLVGLTAAGLELVDTALERLIEHERSLLQGLTPPEQHHLAHVLRSLLIRFETTPG